MLESGIRETLSGEQGEQVLEIEDTIDVFPRFDIEVRVGLTVSPANTCSELKNKSCYLSAFQPPF